MVDSKIVEHQCNRTAVTAKAVHQHILAASQVYVYEPRCRGKVLLYVAGRIIGDEYATLVLSVEPCRQQFLRDSMVGHGGNNCLNALHKFFIRQRTYTAKPESR